MARTTEDRIAAAQAAFEAGFTSEAARKRALEQLSRAYYECRDKLMHVILAARTPENEKANSADYWAIPGDLHNVRDRHFEIAARYADGFGIVRDLIALSAAIKAEPIAKVERSAEAERVEKVRRTLIEEMERRKTAFVEGLDLARLWNEMFPRANGGISLPVTVNAHLVRGHKGTTFVRHFFFLRGKLTPLNTILAIAEQMEREASA